MPSTAWGTDQLSSPAESTPKHQVRVHGMHCTQAQHPECQALESPLDLSALTLPMQISDEAQARMKAAVASMIPPKTLEALSAAPEALGDTGAATLVLQPRGVGQPTDAVLVGVPMSGSGQPQQPVAMLPVAIRAPVEGGAPTQ